jgi:hypothetical protein
MKMSLEPGLTNSTTIFPNKLKPVLGFGCASVVGPISLPHEAHARLCIATIEVQESSFVGDSLTSYRPVIAGFGPKPHVARPKLGIVVEVVAMNLRI